MRFVCEQKYTLCVINVAVLEKQESFTWETVNGTEIV